MRDILSKFVPDDKAETADGKIALFYFITESIDDAREALSKLTNSSANLDSYIKELADEGDDRKIESACLAIEIEKETGEIRACTISPTADDEDGSEDLDCIDIDLSSDDIIFLLEKADCDEILICSVKNHFGYMNS